MTKVSKAKKEISFADVVHQQIKFDTKEEAEELVTRLVDTFWVQRLRHISQTGNTRLVYMFSEHSRFGHSLGVAYLATLVMRQLSKRFLDQVQPWRSAVSVAGLLHDLGHIAPGSHTAYKAWFPGQPDKHEEVTLKIIKEDPEINNILGQYSTSLRDQVLKILDRDPSIPAWTWQIISGSGWNVDRGNWCIADSIMAGVSYGRYNIEALVESLVIAPNGCLALRENRLDAMMHFAVSRHAMYMQVYQHRVLLSADTLDTAIVARARDVMTDLPYADSTMNAALKASHVENLSLEDIFAMDESWWNYHLQRWCKAKDSCLADLSRRLLKRDLFKTIRIEDPTHEKELVTRAKAVLSELSLDSKYYLHKISSIDMNQSEAQSSMMVMLENGTLKSISEVEPLYKALTSDSRDTVKSWIAIPKEAKQRLL